MSQWQPIDATSVNLKGRFVRTTVALPNTVNQVSESDARTVGKRVTIPKGAVGYCVKAEVGALWVGFERGFARPGEGGMGDFPMIVHFTITDVRMRRLEAEAPGAAADTRPGWMKMLGAKPVR